LSPVSKVGLDDPSVILTNTANLDRFTDVPFYPPTKCDPKFLVLQCNCTRVIVPSTCMSLDCLGCRDHIGKRRTQSVVRRLLNKSYGQRNNYNRKPILYTVLTVPESIREHYYLQPQEWRKVRRKLWHVLKNYFGALYGVEATHPVGDKDPKAFHPHLNFLWVQRKGFRPFLDVDRLRLEWQKILNVETADVYSQYTSDIRRIYHWAKYVTRTFPGTHDWTGPMRWFGKYPKIKIIRECHCSECQSQFRVIGTLDARLVNEWQETGMLMGRDPPWHDDNLVVRFKGKSSAQNLRENLT